MLLYTLLTTVEYFQGIFNKYVTYPYVDLCDKLYHKKMKSIKQYDMVKYRSKYIYKVTFWDHSWDILDYLLFGCAPIGRSLFVPKYDENAVYAIEIWNGSKYLTRKVFELHADTDTDADADVTVANRQHPSRHLLLVTVNDRVNITDFANNHYSSLGKFTAKELIITAFLDEGLGLSSLSLSDRKQGNKQKQPDDPVIYTIQFYKGDHTLEVVEYKDNEKCVI